MVRLLLARARVLVNGHGLLELMLLLARAGSGQLVRRVGPDGRQPVDGGRAGAGQVEGRRVGLLLVVEELRGGVVVLLLVLVRLRLRLELGRPWMVLFQLVVQVVHGHGPESWLAGWRKLAHSGGGLRAACHLCGRSAGQEAGSGARL